MSDAKLWGGPFAIGGAEWHLVGGRCDLVPIDIETTREQRTALGYEEAAYDAVLPLALAAGASVGHPLLASADYGEPLRVTLLHGAPSLSPIPGDVDLDGIVPGAAAVFAGLAADLEHTDLSDLGTSDFAIDSLPTMTDLLTMLADWAEDSVDRVWASVSYGDIEPRVGEAAERQIRREVARLEREHPIELRLTIVEALGAARESRSGGCNPSLTQTLSRHAAEATRSEAQDPTREDLSI